MSGFRYYAQAPKEELSLPSFIPDDKVFIPQEQVTLVGGIALVNGRIVVDGILRDTDV